MMKMITDGTVNTAVTGAAAIMPFVLPADISKVTVQDKKRQNEGFDAFFNIILISDQPIDKSSAIINPFDVKLP